MCLRLDAASIAVPSGKRPDPPAFSAAGLGEGLHFTSSFIVLAMKGPAYVADPYPMNDADEI